MDEPDKTVSPGDVLTMDEPGKTVSSDDKSTIRLGEYIILQKGNFKKIHQLSKNCRVMLGRDQLDLRSIIGQKYWTTFKMIHKKGSKREFELTPCDKSESLLNLIDKEVQGVDNRNIWDDGSSQSMSAEEIIKLRDKGCSGQDIVGHLLENSKTFHCKTEYSQQKYLKKKEKKYFEYLTVLRPNVRIISQILYSKDPQKILNLRYDTLAQIVTAVNLQPTGNYILFESGCQGLISALILNQLGGHGHLIHLFPNVHYQKHAVLAMNFSQKELNSFISIRLSTFLNKVFPSKLESGGNKDCEPSDTSKENVVSSSDLIKEDGTKSISEEGTSVDGVVDKGFDNGFTVGRSPNSNLPVEDGDGIGPVSENQPKIFAQSNCDQVLGTDESNSNDVSESNEASEENSCKRKLGVSENGDLPPKRFKWEVEVDRAADLVTKQKADGLIIICKEYPILLVNELIKLVALSRNIVVYSMYQEPIVKLYCELKLRRDVIAVRLTETFLRNYQVLPDRTHPEINMSSSGGFLLSATVVNPEESAPFRS